MVGVSSEHLEWVASGLQAQVVAKSGQLDLFGSKEFVHVGRLTILQRMEYEIYV